MRHFKSITEIYTFVFDRLSDYDDIELNSLLNDLGITYEELGRMNGIEMYELYKIKSRKNKIKSLKTN